MKPHYEPLILSRHYVAYALEALTGKHYLHGQLIGLCVVLVGAFQVCMY